MWEAMNTLVQVSVVDNTQPQTKVVETKNHHLHRRNPQERGGTLPPHWDLSFSENSLFSVYCFIKNFIGATSTGANTVAIDNKIEQAMDLVKSHLMFAVREEVEVLKEKITELLERISQLEHENDILRANASAETLKQLNNQKKTSGGGTTGKPQPVAAVPPPST
ncbi:TSC22 domain family protein 1-like isoform X2 [Stegodyphus dumicola]|uniref:TSC22 domain family protein 1-like isoform X2 n=1 Tax=Stegodyphus dumicola TaxID=202533 RepID=UPI0015B15285|nr:TSC22 domain family protein 1-like isoform X2 [Stegodyphus dumicola]